MKKLNNSKVLEKDEGEKKHFLLPLTLLNCLLSVQT